MIRLLIIILYIPFISIYTLFDFLISKLLNAKDDVKIRKHASNVALSVFKFLLFVSGARVYVSGLENIDKLSNEKAYFIVSNHRGFFDIISGYQIFNRYVGIVAKDNLGKIPVLSYWMKKIHCVFLDRNNLRDGVRMILNSIQNINDGISMWVFPEGTRSKREDPTELLEFKAGAFKIAEKTDSYILPVAFRNTEKVFENQKPFLKPADIYIYVGEPIKYSSIEETNRNDIGNYYQNIIKNLLLEDKQWQRI